MAVPVHLGFELRYGRVGPETGIDAAFGIDKADIGFDAAARLPVRTVLSGPSTGVVGAQAIGRLAGIPDMITFDMGGTSTDVALLSNGDCRLASEAIVHGYPIKAPMLDIHTVGAGGGSIASVNDAGLLQVGPDSAGAMPGPICFGRGGTRVTITDANLLLGRLNHGKLLSVTNSVSLDTLKDAIELHAAEPPARLLVCGGGVHNRRLMERIAAAGIVLEICPTSNLLTKALPDEEALRRTFRAFVEHLIAAADRAEAAEAPVVEEGTEGVRVMTAHKAKGLEFPIVVLGDMTSNEVQERPSRWVDPARGATRSMKVRSNPSSGRAVATSSTARTSPSVPMSGHATCRAGTASVPSGRATRVASGAARSASSAVFPAASLPVTVELMCIT